VSWLGLLQLTYQSMEWKGQLSVEAEPATLSVVTLETTKDDEKLTMVNTACCVYMHAEILCFVSFELKYPFRWLHGK